MMRRINFIGKKRAVTLSVQSVFVGVVLLAIAQFVFSFEQSAFTYGLVIIGAVLDYVMTARKCNSNLSTDDEEIYLFGIPAALRYQKSLLGRQYIRITSMTDKGYHRIKVYKPWVSASDWQFMLARCT